MRRPSHQPLRALDEWVRSNAPIDHTKPSHALGPAEESSNQKEQSSQSRLLTWRIDDVGPLDTLDRITLARISLSTAKAVRQERQTSFAGSLRHAQRILCQALNALLQVALAGDLHNDALVTNPEIAIKLLHTNRLFYSQSSDERCSRQGRYNEYTRRELVDHIDWRVVCTERGRQKAREDTPQARRIRTSKLTHERGGITKAADALISPRVVARGYRTLVTQCSRLSTKDPAAIATS